MRAVIVVPTYWTGMKNEKRSSHSIYDHPTPLNGKSTLGRLLKSFRLLNGIEHVDILVLGCSTHKDIQHDVKNRLQKIINKNKGSTNVLLFSDVDLPKLYRVLKKQNITNSKELLSLHGYSNIRNMSLFIPHVLGYDTIISIDDDELITSTNTDYLTKITTTIKKGYQGIAGYYTSKDNPAVVVKKHPWSEVIHKSALMKKQLDSLCNATKTLNPTFFALGGNMVLTSHIFTQVPFDPGVSRGEDMDYVMNARFFDHVIYFHKHLFIEHRPPHHSQPEWLTLRKEIVRFTYQSEKLAHQQVKKGMKKITEDQMGFYPGTFLQGDIYKLFDAMNNALLKYYIKKKDATCIAETKRNATLITKLHGTQGTVFDAYMTFQKEWSALMGVVTKKQDALQKQVQLFF